MKTSIHSTTSAPSTTASAFLLLTGSGLLRRAGAGFLAVLLMALAMLAATPAMAATITRTFDFTASNFFPTGNRPTVTGTISVTFDPAVSATNQTAGGTVHNLSIPYIGVPLFDYDPSTNRMYIGAGAVANNVSNGSNDFILSIQDVSNRTPIISFEYTNEEFSQVARAGTVIDRGFQTTGGWVNGGNFNVGAVGTDWPAAESPDSAVDGDANTKFLIFRGSNAGLILTPNAGPAAFNRLALTTANDAPERDPASYIIYGSPSVLPTTGSIAISSLTQVASGTLALTNDRTTGPAIVQFNNTTPYASYVVVFPEVKNDPASNIMQIAEVKLSQGITVPNQVQMGKARGGQVKSGAGAFSDRFTFGTVRGASDPEGNNWPAGESPDHALDGDASSKYLFFRKADNGILDTYFAALMVNPELGPAAVNSVSFWTANDAPERDPATYKIYAATTANTQTSGEITVSGFGISSWVQIATGALTLPAERGDGPTIITFPNTTPYASYLLVFSSVKNSPATTLTQIAEVAFAYNPPNAAPSFSLTPTVPAGTLLFPRETNRNWRSITSSADGTKLAAVGSGTSIYTSSDSGVTWSAREIFRSRFYTSIASSADGTKLAATANNELIYTSSDSGVTWTGRASEQKWTSIASSDDGTKLVAVVSDDYIYTSSDSGVTWIRQTGSGKAFWTSVTSSGDGTKLVAGGTNGNLYVSADSGVTWSAKPSSGSRNWRAIDSSEDGSTVVAVGQMSVANGPPPRDIFVSTDGGETWTQRGFTSLWSGITCSADGTRMAVCDDEAGIYTSEDSGTTWTLSGGRFLQWNAITSSADGNRLAATVNGGQIYTSEAYANVNVTVGSGAFTAAGFATNISAGRASESGQTVSFSLSADTASLFTTQPAIANDGTLTFTPGSTTGVATITVTATDDGGTADGGVDTSAPRLFTITILPAVPTVASISPDSGSTLGNDSVTITGTDFTGATSVTIGGTAATNINVVSATSITARTAAHAAGLVDVAVTTPSGTGTGEGLFTYIAPVTSPTVTSPTSAAITHNSATLGGNVTGDGGSPILERGIVYLLDEGGGLPVIDGDGVVKVTASGTTGVFTVPVTGLSARNDYSYRAYAINAIGTSYTGVATYTTTAPVGPAIQVARSSDYVSGDSFDYGDTYVGEIESLDLRIRNDGTEVLNLNGTPIVALSGADADQFMVVAQPAQNSLAPGETVFVTIDFQPTSAGAKSATLTIASNDPSVPSFTLVLEGSPRIPLEPTVTGISPASGPTVGGTSVTITGTNFNGVTSVTIGGTPATSFTVDLDTRILAITPAHAAGPADVTVGNAGGTGTGTGLFTFIGQPEIDVEGYDFEEEETFSIASGTGTGFRVLPIGLENSNVYTIRNIGDATLNLTGTPKVALTGSQAFSIVEQPATGEIAPGEFVEVTVAFNPTNTELMTATLSIASNDADENPYTINLSGTGIPAPETVKIGGNTVLSVPNFGSNTTVTNPLTGETVITGTVNGETITDSLSFTLPAGKVVTHAILQISNYVAAEPLTTGGFHPGNSHAVTYSSHSAYDSAFGETEDEAVVDMTTRCATTTFSFIINAPEAESERVFTDPFSGFPMFETERTFGSASYVLTLQIGDAAAEKTLTDLTSSNSTLSPAFASGVTSYSATVPTEQTFVELTPTWTAPTIYATRQVNGDSATEIGSGFSDLAGLVEGANSVLYRVCAQDGTETVYTVNITRGESNIAPTFSGYAFSTAKNTQAQVATAKILARAADADGGTLTISSVGAATAQGGGASVSGGLLTYTPLLNFIGMDSIAVTISDGQGGSVTGSIIVTVTDGTGPSLNEVSLTILPSGYVGMLFQGIPGQEYEIQRSTNLIDWTTIHTITAAPDGTIPWLDENPTTENSAFYRTATN